MDPYIQLAREAINQFIVTQEEDFVMPEWVTPEMLKQEAGVFVALQEANGKIRGCVGTISATQENVAIETIANAISAATKDPRYKPLSPADLADLRITVYLLDEPEEIESISGLDQQTYGVIVEKGEKRGLTLPAQPGIASIQEQLDDAMKKAGILDGLYNCKLFRFKVEKHAEN